VFRFGRANEPSCFGMWFSYQNTGLRCQCKRMMAALIKFPESGCKTCRTLVLRDLPNVTEVKGSFPEGLEERERYGFDRLYLKHVGGIEHETRKAFPGIHEDVCDGCVADAMMEAHKEGVSSAEFRIWVTQRAKWMVLNEIDKHHHERDDNVSDALWLMPKAHVSTFVPQEERGPDYEVEADDEEYQPDIAGSYRHVEEATAEEEQEQATLDIYNELPEPHKQYPSLQPLLDMLHDPQLTWKDKLRIVSRRVVVTHWPRSTDGLLYKGKSADYTIPLGQHALEYHEARRLQAAREAVAARHEDGGPHDTDYKGTQRTLEHMRNLAYVPPPPLVHSEHKQLVVYHGIDADGKAIPYTLEQMRPYGLWRPWHESDQQREANEGRFRKSPWQDPKWLGTPFYHYGLYWEERELWAEGEAGASAYDRDYWPPDAVRRSRARKGPDYEGDACRLGPTLMQRRYWRDLLGEQRETAGILDTPSASSFYWPGPRGWTVDENEKHVNAIRLAGYLGCYCYNCTRGQHSREHPANHAGFVGGFGKTRDVVYLVNSVMVEEPEEDDPLEEESED
jgi:hypothetical protein